MIKHLLFPAILFSSFICFFPVHAQDSSSVIQNGYQKFYYKNHVLSSEGTMRDGKPDGYWKTYSESGKLRSEGNRKNFELDSTWNFYNDDGKPILQINYKNGRKEGIKTTWMDKEIIRENFKNDIKEGITRYYYSDEKLKSEVPFVKGLEQGLGREYSKDGEITGLTEYRKGFVVERIRINRRDKNNLKQGRWVVFFPSGIIKQEGNYRDDKKDGYFKEYAENGDLISVTKYVDDVLQTEAAEIKKPEIKNEYYPTGQIKSSATFRNGVAEGIKREFDTAGNVIRSGIYHNGELTGEGIILEDGSRTGPWKEYYPGGALKSAGEYKNGKPVGEWKYYFPDGKIEQAGKFTQGGKLTGNWKWYYDNGKLLREEDYLNGQLDGMHTEYDEDGNVTEEGEYAKDLEEGPWMITMGDYLERGTYRDGLRNGNWISYYLFKNAGKTDSIISHSGGYVEDNPDGKHVWYYEDGKIREEGTFVMGKREGDWYRYNSDGTLFMIITYRSGTEVKYDGVKLKPPFESGE